MNSDSYKEEAKSNSAPDGSPENASGAANDKTEAAGQSADPIQELQAKLQESDKKYLYLYSEFENFRRRAERDRLEFVKFGHEGFLKELLQVLDNFERALEHAKGLSAGTEKGSPVAQVGQGIEMIHYQLLEALKAQGVTEIKAVGAKFDPALHEAVSEEASDSEPGIVLKVMQKGYLLHGRLLRAARVVVAKS
ncbi:MAG: nucleotide exchange factor GrpE [Bdellovibrionota bacterium]